MLLDNICSKKFNLSRNIAIKCRIDRKIVVMKDAEEPEVLDSISSRLIQAFNGGTSLEKIFDNRKIEEPIKEKVFRLSERNLLVETNEKYVLNLQREWTLDEVFFELTKRCNLRCRHCYIPKNIDKGEMTLEEWKIQVDACKEMHVGLIKLTGGEAMLYPYFWDIISYIQKQKIRMRLYTNGSFLTSETIPRLLENGIRECQISLDGGTADVHNAFRRTENNFEKIMKALPILEKEGMKVDLSFTLSDFNREEVEDFVQIANRFSNIKIVVSPYINYHQTSTDKCDLYVDDEMLHKLKTCFENNKMKWSDKTKYYYTFSNRFIGYCGAGVYMLYIDSQGKVMICPLLNQKENMVGNVREVSLQEIWRESAFLQNYRKSGISDIEGCNCCENANECRGGCRARAFMKSGKLLAKDEVSCRMF